MQSESFSSFPNFAFFCLALFCSVLSYSWLMVSNTVSDTWRSQGIKNCLPSQLGSYLILPALRYHQREVFVQLLICFGQLQTFRVLLVEGADIEGVRGIDFPAGRNERRWILLLVDLSPVHTSEEGMSLELLSPLTRTTESLVDVTLRSKWRIRNEELGWSAQSWPAAVTPTEFWVL